jgi:hypothetical protein
MQISDLIIVILLAILFFMIFFKNNKKNNDTNQSLTKNYSINEKNINLSSSLEPMSVSNMMVNIVDKAITSPRVIKPFDITDDIPINNNYDVQPGLYDQQPLPKKVIEQPMGEKINKTLEQETKTVEYFNEEDKTIAQLYDELIDTQKFKEITKESLEKTERELPAYKGSSLDINNWTLYKNDKFLNGGNYDTLMGINQFERDNTFRIPDSYNDFEIKEFI